MSTRVVLQRFPVSLFLALEEHTDALLREYVLRSLGDADQNFGVAEAARAATARGMVAAALRRDLPPTDDRDPAGGSDVVHELVVDLGAATAADFGLLQTTLDDAIRLANAGELLTMPSLPEIVALRNWICDQVSTQLAGAPPAPWNLAEASLEEEAGRPLAEWDGAGELSPHEAALVSDDHHRIIAATPGALQLLGWDEHELLGQRLIVVIPPTLRERHVAAFTRVVVTGEGRLLGQPLDLVALTRDGREIPVTLTLSQHRARRGRTVFLGRLQSRAV